MGSNELEAAQIALQVLNNAAQIKDVKDVADKVAATITDDDDDTTILEKTKDIAGDVIDGLTDVGIVALSILGVTNSSYAVLGQILSAMKQIKSGNLTGQAGDK